jgi:Aspartyl/Asparaginyl beta-hydroxylase
MQFDKPFLQLPRRYDAEVMAREIGALPAAAWVPHPGKLPGNDAVLLITPEGELTNTFTGPMLPTEFLHSCPYLMEIMADLGATWGRSRLMGLAPGGEVPKHFDLNYYWRTHIRVHVPIVTNPSVEFMCDDETIHMAPGECWVFDTFRPHRVRNGGSEKRVHLVLDTVGGEGFCKIIDEARAGAAPPAQAMKPGTIPASSNIRYENINTPTVMSPWEVRCHSRYLLDRVASSSPVVAAVTQRLDRFGDEWMGIWSNAGAAEDAYPDYRRLVAAVQADLRALGAEAVLLNNSSPLLRALSESIFKYAVPAASDPLEFGGAAMLQRLAS